MTVDVPSGARVLVIGGAGHIGKTLVADLRRHGLTPGVADALPEFGGDVPYFGADVRSREALLEAFRQFRPAACVHLAAYGMSGSAMQSPLCHAINVDGTKNVLQACLDADCPALVYLSTYNVCYGGEPIVAGNEATPLFDPERHCDQYSRTKSLAEALLLGANGRPCANGTPLLTCAIRPAAIYGPDEIHHFGRIVATMDGGAYSLGAVGSRSALVDWVHAEHVAQACRLAVANLLGNKRAAGRAYFVADGDPLNTWEFLQPLAEAVGAPYPRVFVPIPMALLLARLAEWVSFWSGVEPLLTRAEVIKVGTTHYFSIEAAKQDLGYRPIMTSTEGARQTAERHAHRSDNRRYFRYAAAHSPLLTIAATVGLTAFWYLAFVDDGPADSPWNSPLAVLRTVAYFIFRTKWMMQLGFIASVFAHIAEALYACYVAQSMGCELWLRWGLQTLWLGFPSLSLLLARRRDWPPKSGPTMSAPTSATSQ